MTTQQNAADLMNDLLDATLDDLADIPEFKPFPAGAHRCVFTYELKVINNIGAIQVGLKGIETVELANPEESDTNKPIKEGDSTNILLLMKNKDGTKNEFSEGTLKMIIAGLKDSFPADGTNRGILEAAQNAEVIAVTKIGVNKKDPNDIKYNTNLVGLQAV